MAQNELENAIARTLSTVREPRSGRDLLTAGIVRSIDVDGADVVVTVELRDGPERQAVAQAVRDAVSPLPAVAAVAVRFEEPDRASGGAAAGGGPRRLPMAGGSAPPAGPAAGPAGPGGPQSHAQGIASRQQIPGVKHLIAVASGKGGVGKSTVCVNLALALNRLGARVGLLDADIYGPSVPLMMNVSRKPQAGPDGRILPLPSYGLKVMSLGLLLDEGTPVIWRGPMVQGVVRQFLHEVNWGELDYLMIDLPPGTGDAQLTLVQSVALSGALIVTTPSDVALIDAAKGLTMFRQVQVPVFGIVENMSYFMCPHCDERTDIFSSKGGQRVADKLGSPFLGEIPLDLAIRQGGDEGKPVMAAMPDSASAEPFVKLAKLVKQACEGTGEEKKGFFKSLFARG